MMIYKIFRASEWDALERSGETAGAPIDLADGFIHFSTADQVGETLSKHFHGQKNLLLVAVPSLALGDALKWEVSRGGALFPHLYASLNVNAAEDVSPIEDLKDGSHRLPELPA
ncbi:MAG: DUF952 domain-containing protein [Pseudomonadota bacterium]